MASRKSTLVIMPPDRRARLVAHLELMQADLLTAASCSEAGELLRKRPGVCVVLTDQNLPDGSWADVLSLVKRHSSAVRVIVCPRVGDERLWVQALDAGAFDVLPEPYHGCEVQRIVGSAARQPFASAAARRPVTASAAAQAS